MGMRDCANHQTGAMVERGTIAENAGNGEYRVKSLDRPGITSQPIAAANSEAYSAGDMVYCFIFCDGTGKIICKA